VDIIKEKFMENFNQIFAGNKYQNSITCKFREKYSNIRNVLPQNILLEKTINRISTGNFKIQKKKFSNQSLAESVKLERSLDVKLLQQWN
jgi:hypothetical protein